MEMQQIIASIFSFLRPSSKVQVTVTYTD